MHKCEFSVGGVRVGVTRSDRRAKPSPTIIPHGLNV